MFDEESVGLLTPLPGTPAVQRQADSADPFVESSDDALGFSLDLWRIGEEYFAGLSEFDDQ